MGKHSQVWALKNTSGYEILALFFNRYMDIGDCYLGVFDFFFRIYIKIYHGIIHVLRDTRYRGSRYYGNGTSIPHFAPKQASIMNKDKERCFTVYVSQLRTMYH